MPNSNTSDVYARLAFETAVSTGEGRRWLKELFLLADHDVNEIERSCESSTRSGTLLDGCLPEVVEFVCMLGSRGKARRLPDLARSYARLLDQHYGLVTAEVVTAAPLDEDQVLAFEERLSVRHGQEVVVTTRVEPSVVGGFIVRIGDSVLDYSVRARLDSIRRALIGAKDTD